MTAPKPPGILVTILAFPARLALGGLFAYAGALKIADPQKFSEAVRAFKIIPEQAQQLILSITFTLPWLELLAGVAVILGFWTRAAAALLAAASAAFVAGLLSLLARDISTSCACFGDAELFCSGPVGWCHVARTAAFLVVALLLLAIGPGRLAIDTARR